MRKNISVIMTYYNRRSLLQLTLRTIELSRLKDNIEVVIVDDCSSETERIDDFCGLFSFPINLIRMDTHGKYGGNPSVLYNIGFAEADGDIFVLTNPENFHCGDVLSHVANNMSDNVYLLYTCRDLPQTDTEVLLNKVQMVDNSLLIQSIEDSLVSNGSWNKYKKLRDYLHFCSAISRKDLIDLNGFDERYKDGSDFDDDEFFERVSKKGMIVKKFDETCPFVFHQYHKKYAYENMSLYLKRYAINKNLFFNFTKKEDGFRANVEKNIFSGRNK